VVISFDWYVDFDIRSENLYLNSSGCCK